MSLCYSFFCRLSSDLLLLIKSRYLCLSDQSSVPSPGHSQFGWSWFPLDPIGTVSASLTLFLSNGASLEPVLSKLWGNVLTIIFSTSYSLSQPYYSFTKSNILPLLHIHLCPEHLIFFFYARIHPPTTFYTSSFLFLSLCISQPLKPFSKISSALSSTSIFSSSLSLPSILRFFY